MSRRLIALLAVLALVAPALAAGPAAAQEYDISELKEGGKTYATDSQRLDTAHRRIYWLEHSPPSQPWVTVDKGSNGPKLAAGDRLTSNRLYLRTLVTDEGGITKSVKIVSWQRDTRKVKAGNGTTTETVATNVSTTTQQVGFDPVQGVAEISLPNHAETHQITMWVEDAPSEARWRFEHKSVATTQPISISNWTDFVMLSGLFVIFPAVAMQGYGSKKIKDAIDSAAKGPGHGFVYYAAVITALTGGIVMLAYTQLAEIIVAVPFVLGAYVALIGAGYTLATHEGTSEEKLFWRPHIESVEAFSTAKFPSVGSGNADDSMDFAEDMPFGVMQSYTVVDEGQRGISIIRDGWGPFLARIKGGRAKIENAHELKTRFSLFDSEWDECFIVDPEADELIDYEPPGLTLKTPDIETWTDAIWPGAIAAGAIGGTYWAAQQYGAVAWATLLVVGAIYVWVYAVEGTDSYCRLEPAPAALRPVLASMLVMSIGNRDAHKLQEAESFAWKALARQEDVELDELRRGDDSIIGNAFEPSYRDDGEGTIDETSPGIESDVDEIDTDDLTDEERNDIHEVLESDDPEEQKGGAD